MALYYKLARPNGWDFHTGKTINYREAIGQMVQPPNANPQAKLCSPGILHASLIADDCFQGASIPCSLYEIEGNPVCADTTKAGFVEMRVLRELDPATHVKWRYAQAVNPLNPFKLTLQSAPTAHDLALLRQWASTWDSVGDSVEARVGASVGASAWAPAWDSVRARMWDMGASVGARVGASVRASVGAPAWDSVRARMWDMGASVGARVGASVRASVGAPAWDSVGARVGASVGDSVEAYVGWIFTPVVTDLEYIMPAVRLWQRGLVPSYDGRIWRLHSGSNAQVVWQGKMPS